MDTFPSPFDVSFIWVSLYHCNNCSIWFTVGHYLCLIMQEWEVGLFSSTSSLSPHPPLTVGGLCSLHLHVPHSVTGKCLQPLAVLYPHDKAYPLDTSSQKYPFLGVPRYHLILSPTRRALHLFPLTPRLVCFPVHYFYVMFFM